MPITSGPGQWEGRIPKDPALMLLACAVSYLDGGNVLRLHALIAAGRLVGNLGTLFEGPEPTTGYPAVMHEEVIATLVGSDEAVALLVVEPLDRSLGYVLKPAFLFLGLITIEMPPPVKRA